MIHEYFNDYILNKTHGNTVCNTINDLNRYIDEIQEIIITRNIILAESVIDALKDDSTPPSTTSNLFDSTNLFERQTSSKRTKSSNHTNSFKRTHSSKNTTSITDYDKIIQIKKILECT